MPVCVLISSSYNDTHHAGLQPCDHFYLNYLFKSPISKYSHILRQWGLELQHVNFKETQFSAYKVIFTNNYSSDLITAYFVQKKNAILRT